MKHQTYYHDNSTSYDYYMVSKRLRKSRSAVNFLCSSSKWRIWTSHLAHSTRAVSNSFCKAWLLLPALSCASNICCWFATRALGSDDPCEKKKLNSVNSLEKTGWGRQWIFLKSSRNHDTSHQCAGMLWWWHPSPVADSLSSAAVSSAPFRSQDLTPQRLTPLTSGSKSNHFFKTTPVLQYE